MTAPDGGGIYGAQVSVGGDGSFEVESCRGARDAIPAEVTISITGVVGDTQVTATGCTDQFAPVAESTFQVALESSAPEPVVLVAEGTADRDGVRRGQLPGDHASTERRPAVRSAREPGAGCRGADHAGADPGARSGRTSRAGRRQRRARMARGAGRRRGSRPGRTRRLASPLPPLATPDPAAR
jgi:hypothetical protein